MIIDRLEDGHPKTLDSPAQYLKLQLKSMITATIYEALQEFLTKLNEPRTAAVLTEDNDIKAVINSCGSVHHLRDKILNAVEAEDGNSGAEILEVRVLNMGYELELDISHTWENEIEERSYNLILTHFF